MCESHSSAKATKHRQPFVSLTRYLQNKKTVACQLWRIVKRDSKMTCMCRLLRHMARRQTEGPSIVEGFNKPTRYANPSSTRRPSTFEQIRSRAMPCKFSNLASFSFRFVMLIWTELSQDVMQGWSFQRLRYEVIHACCTRY